MANNNVVRPHRGWTPSQVKRFVLDAKNRNEHCWYLIPALRDALIAREYASVVSSLHGEVTCTELKHLWQDMNAELERLNDVEDRE